MGALRLAWLSFVRRRWALLLVVLPTAILFAIVTTFFSIESMVQSVMSVDDWDRRVIRVGTGTLVPDSWFTEAEVEHLKHVEHVTMVAGHTLALCATKEEGSNPAAMCVGSTPEYIKIWRNQIYITDAELDKWSRMKNGVIVTTAQAKRHNWKVGDQISVPFKDPNTPPAELVISSIAEQGYGFEQIYVHPEYLGEHLGKPTRYWVAWVMVDKVENRQAVMDALPADYPSRKITLTRMEDTKAILTGASRLLVTFFRVSAALAILLLLAVAFSVLIVSIEERRRQLATLRAIGCRRGFLFRLIVGESVFLLLPGALLGGVIAFFVLSQGIRVITFVAKSNILYPMMTVAAATTIAMCAALIPAWRASRRDVLEALRD